MKCIINEEMSSFILFANVPNWWLFNFHGPGVRLNDRQIRRKTTKLTHLNILRIDYPFNGRGGKLTQKDFWN